MSKLDKIKVKITKLISLAEDVSASPGEIENAVAAATRLMAQNNLTRDDIDLNDEADPTKSVKLGRHCAISKTYSIKAWEHSLADFVCEFIGYVTYYSEGPMPLKRNGIAILDDKGNLRKGCLIWFYGSDDDCVAAVELFEELRDTITIMAVTRYGAWSRGDGAVYAQGFCSGLRKYHQKAVCKLRASNDETRALMVQDRSNQTAVRKKAKAWLGTKQGIYLTRSRGSSGGSGSTEALEAGFQDGSNHAAQRPGTTKKLA